MRLSFFPRESKFFLLLQQSAVNIKDTSIKLLDLMENYEKVEEKVAEIKRLEEVGDQIIHSIMQNLHRTFVTPMDREDIAVLGELLDDVVDSIEEAARYMLEYHIDKPTERAKELARIIVRCSEALEKAMKLLRFRGTQLREILPLKDELNTLEDEADQITSHAMGELFNYNSPIEVLKWKEIYAQLEAATDRCEQIAGVLEGMVIKNA